MSKLQYVIPIGNSSPWIDFELKQIQMEAVKNWVEVVVEGVQIDVELQR